MAKKQYQPLSRIDEDEGKEKAFISGEDGSRKTTSCSAFAVCIAALLVSLAVNVLLLTDSTRICDTSRDSGKTKYSGITFDTMAPFHSYSDYWNPNISDEITDANWDAIDTNPMAISLHDDFAEQVGLGPSTRFPWDTERSIYYIKGFHDLHCLKLIRKAIVSKHNQDNRTFTLSHLFHCLDGLRQDVMCTADDTPMPALVAHHVGDGQLRKCRDWNKLTAWATRPDQQACHDFDDYREATNTLEVFGHCPQDSPYRPVMEAYFEYHGHKDPYEPKESDDRVVF
ncbi:hypothetical protein P171DRAFT_57618 [Karstenula rhodostoma CBS 690.94]|uniref:Uncharacterized protein n=1 Tax=Karstenula rhodostoma CBS 690.94 TaxID=1392251 RepID=A0A9P4PFY6_9PLEO|nr:hypothetical protein P171DRAFT_57618 [Karstenula rhodostoma CBS 690.94]